MVDSDGHGQYLAPSEDLIKFELMCDVLQHFYCCAKPSKLQASSRSPGLCVHVPVRVGDLMMDSDGHGQYLGQYLAPSEDLVKFELVCDVLEHF